MQLNNTAQVIDSIHELNVSYDDLYSIIESNRVKSEYIIDGRGEVIKTETNTYINNCDLLEADSYVKFLIYECKYKVDQIHKINEYVEEKFGLAILEWEIKPEYFKSDVYYDLWNKYLKEGNLSIYISEYEEGKFVKFPPYSMLAYSDIFNLIEMFELIPLGILTIKLWDNPIKRILN